mgnify:FL=1
MADIHDPLTGNLGEHGDGRSVGIEFEVRHGVGVGGEDDLAS